MLVLCFYTTSLNLKEHFHIFFLKFIKIFILNLTGRIIQMDYTTLLMWLIHSSHQQLNLKCTTYLLKNAYPSKTYSLFFLKKKKVKKTRQLVYAWIILQVAHDSHWPSMFFKQKGPLCLKVTKFILHNLIKIWLRLILVHIKL